MFRPVIIKALLVLLLASVAFGLWLAEVRVIKGWEGLAWLKGYPWSSLPICVLAAMAIVIAMKTPLNRVATWRLAAFVGAAAVAFLAAFELARVSLIVVHSRGYLAELTTGTVLEQVVKFRYLAALPLALALGSAGPYLGVKLLLAPVSRWTVAYLTCGLLLVVPASLLTIQIFPAVDGSTDYIHAVKMGYPVFWAVVLVSLAVAVGSAQHDRR